MAQEPNVACVGYIRLKNQNTTKVTQLYKWPSFSGKSGSAVSGSSWLHAERAPLSHFPQDRVLSALLPPLLTITWGSEVCSHGPMKPERALSTHVASQHNGTPPVRSSRSTRKPYSEGVLKDAQTGLWRLHCTSTMFIINYI